MQVMQAGGNRCHCYGHSHAPSGREVLLGPHFSKLNCEVTAACMNMMRFSKAYFIYLTGKRNAWGMPL